MTAALRKRTRRAACALISTSLAGLANFAAHAEIVVTANDGKMVLENGSALVRKQPLPDTVSVIDFTDGALKLLGEVPAPASVVGPPPSVAIAPDGAFALVTGAMKLDPADPTKTVPDDKLSVIDLKSTPPKVLATLQAGAGACRRFDQPRGHAGAGCEPQRRNGLGLHHQRGHACARRQDLARRRQIRPQPRGLFP
ncbi:hypothetical protein ACVWZV_003608 [Bradyrhizobium sp. GM5.1]